MPSGAASTHTAVTSVGPALGEQLDGVDHRAAGGEHRVEDEHRAPASDSGSDTMYGVGLVGLLVAGHPDEPDLRLRHERLRGVHHPEPGAQHRHEQRRAAPGCSRAVRATGVWIGAVRSGAARMAS